MLTPHAASFSLEWRRAKAKTKHARWPSLASGVDRFSQTSRGAGAPFSRVLGSGEHAGDILDFFFES